jgi:hypothetical protein
MSQASELLAHLKQGHSITPKESLDFFGIYRLSARILELREAGHNIVTKKKTVKTRHGSATIAEYHLINRSKKNARNQ